MKYVNDIMPENGEWEVEQYVQQKYPILDNATGFSGKELQEMQLLTVADLCSIMQTSRHTVDKLLHSGELPSCKIGNQYRVTQQALAKFLNYKTRQNNTRFRESMG